MKKIGIITFHNAHNYGAMLQVYALQNKIDNSEVINFKCEEIDKNYKIVKLYKGKNILKLIKSIISNICYFIKNNLRYNSFDKFLKKHIKLSNEYKSEKELKKNPPQYDIYITGSDQVWNHEITKGLTDAYTLNFGDKSIRRISYAASIGNSKIPKELIGEYNEKISKIDCISVREESGKKALQNIGISKKIEVVLDPTLLLTREEWDKEIKENKTNIKGKYILAYVVEPNEEYYKIVKYLSEKTGLKIIHFEKRNKEYKNVLKNAYTSDPFEFVTLIKNAEYVVATSFHATVFSIIYNKKFFIVPHLKTGSRVTDLLDKLEIKNRTFQNLEDFKKIDYKFETNYEEIEKKLEKEREKSIKWLDDAINS